MYTKLILLNAVAILALLQMVTSQNSSATCTTGTASEINIAFDGSAYNRYTKPGPQVKRWHQSGLPDNVTTGDLPDYLMDDVAMASIVPYAVVFALLTLGLLCFMCYRCCGKCRIKEPSGQCELILLVIVIILLFISLIFISIGLDADQDQSDFLTAIPSVVDSFIEITDVIKSAVTNITTTVNDIIDDLDSLPGGAGNGVKTELQDISSALTEIEDTAESVDFDELRDGFVNDLEKVDEQRSQAFRAVFGILCAMVIFTALISLLNAKGPEKFRPKRYCACRCFMGLVKVVTFILFVLVWILSAVLIGFSRLFGDLCFNFDANLVSLAELSGNTETYYISCDENEQLRDCQNPFVGEINTIEDSLSQVDTQWDPIYTSGTCTGNGAAVQATCDDIDEALESLQNQTRQFIGDVLGCAPLNKPYQAIAVLLCSDLAESIGTTTELLIGFSVIFFLAEIFTRLLSDGDPDNEDNDYAGSNKVA
eukprot:m.50436 g.50436  ORF g.50436 m.50436 type:complete len:482 (+) comp13422_c0_seq1:93-1538(+)